jgi:hypothetical protein
VIQDYVQEREAEQENEEKNPKFHRALLAFDNSIIIPVVRCSFEKAVFRSNWSDLLGAVTVNSTPVLERIDAPKLLFDDPI